MTVSTTTSTQSFAGGQATNEFNFKTLSDHPEYIKVKKVLISTGAETDLTYDVDYTVSLNSDGVGGTVTLSPTFSTLYTTTVYRDTEDVQESDYEDYNQFPADTIEEDYDRRTLVSQERKEASDRSLKIPISVSGFSAELPVPVASKYFRINSANDAIELVSLSLTDTQYEGDFSAGADADKAASPSANDLYFATDTNIMYRCATAGSWTAYTTLNIPSGGTMTVTTTSGTVVFTLTEAGALTIPSLVTTTATTTLVTSTTVTCKTISTVQLTASGVVSIGTKLRNYGTATGSGSTVSIETYCHYFGTASVASSGTTAITLVPSFSSNAAYHAYFAMQSTNTGYIVKDSGSQLTIHNLGGAATFSWAVDGVIT